MKFLSRFFRRKPARSEALESFLEGFSRHMDARHPGQYPDNNPVAPSMPTAQDGLKIIDDACEKTLKQGLEGFVIAMVSAPDDKGSHVVVSLNGSVGSGLAQVLAMMLSKPDTKHMTTAAIIAALSESNAAVVVNPNEDCQCPGCVARRADEKASQTTTTH